VETIACWRLDHRGRTCSELASLFECLAACEVNLISLKDEFDLSTPEGRRTANTLALVGLYETELRVERIIAGQEAARAMGIRWGGSKKRATGERHARGGGEHPAPACRWENMSPSTRPAAPAGDSRLANSSRFQGPKPVPHAGDL
jgi:hypothetical protein